MGYQVDRQEKFTIIGVEVEKFNTQHAPDLKGKIIELVEDGVVNLIIDLHGVSYIDSSGLSTLLLANRLTSEKNGTTVIARPSEHVQSMINIAQLGQVLEILPTIDEAREAIFMNDLQNELQAGNQSNGSDN